MSHVPLTWLACPGLLLCSQCHPRPAWMLPAQLWTPCLAILSTLEQKVGRGLEADLCLLICEGPCEEQALSCFVLFRFGEVSLPRCLVFGYTCVRNESWVHGPHAQATWGRGSQQGTSLELKVRGEKGGPPCSLCGLSFWAVSELALRWRLQRELPVSASGTPGQAGWECLLVCRSECELSVRSFLCCR